MKIIKVYDKNFIGRKQREKEEAKLFAEGYQIELEEEFNERSGNCCVALIFWPLLLVKLPKIKVTYSKN
jgi:hypothetical protein